MKLAMKMPIVKYKAWSYNGTMTASGSWAWAWASNKPISWARAGNGKITGAYARACNKSWTSARTGKNSQ